MNYYNNAPVPQILEESVGIVVVISAALLASGREDAASQAALIHQKAGALARDTYGFYSSDELIRFIGKAAIDLSRN